MIIWYNRQNYTVFYTSRFNNVELLKHYFDENTLFSPSILIITSISFLSTIMSWNSQMNKIKDKIHFWSGVVKQGALKGLKYLHV